MRLMDTNLCAEAATTITASSADVNFPASNLKHLFRSKRLRTEIGTTTLRIVFDMQTSEAVDSVCVLWPKEDGVKLTNTATISIQANATNIWDTPALDQSLTLSETYSIASHYFTADQSYRYWSLVIEDAGNPWDYIEVGKVWIGKSLTVENAQNGFKFEIEDQSSQVTTDFGNIYTDEYPQILSGDFSYQYMDYDAIRVLENAFRRNGNRKPVLLVLDAEEDVFDKDHFVIYGVLSNKFTVNHIRYNLFSTGLRIREIL